MRPTLMSVPVTRVRIIMESLWSRLEGAVAHVGSRLQRR